MAAAAAVGLGLERARLFEGEIGGGFEPGFPEVGEWVCLYGSREDVAFCVLGRSGVCATRLGEFRHEDILATPFGCRVLDTRGAKWRAVLRATPSLFTLAVKHRTQILYHADIALILSFLDAAPGMTLFEAGTGTGSLSCALACAVRGGGRLFTFEFHRERWKASKQELQQLGLGQVVTCLHRDVCARGFTCQDECAERLLLDKNKTPLPSANGDGAADEEDSDLNLPPPHSADGLFLDLPAPWLALPWAAKALRVGDRQCLENKTSGLEDARRFQALSVSSSSKAAACGSSVVVCLQGGGRLVTFSPCVEQVQKTVQAAEELGFQGGEGPHPLCLKRTSASAQRGEGKAVGSPPGSTLGKAGLCVRSSTDIRVYEALSKAWGVALSRPAPSGKGAAKRRRTQSSQQPKDGQVQERMHGADEEGAVAGEEETAPQASPGGESLSSRIAPSFAESLAHFLKQPQPEKKSPLPCESPSRSLSAYHFQLPMRGHTGYIAVCLRPALDESLQPRPF